MGITVDPAEGRYLVRQDLNIRDGPDTKHRRLGLLERGSQVDAVGVAAGGNWLAVAQDGEVLGFAYALELLPLIDGALIRPVAGRVTTEEGVRCSYIIAYAGRTEVVDESFETADYDVVFRCQRRGKPLVFDGLMFITEAPYRLNRTPVYQANLDVPSVAPGIDEVLSATALYRRADGLVVFDTVRPASLGRTLEESDRPAASPAEAVRATLEMAVAAWQPRVWAILAGDESLVIEGASGPEDEDGGEKPTNDAGKAEDADKQKAEATPAKGSAPKADAEAGDTAGPKEDAKAGDDSGAESGSED